MPTLADLNQRFARDTALIFDRGQGGLTRALIDTPACIAQAYLHGAHLARWRPAGHDEVLWLSARANFLHDMPIRGGIPLCFPWFAGHKPKGQPKAPSHGLARTTAWDIADTAREGDDITITFATHIAPYDLRYTVTFGRSLKLALEATNTDDCDATFEVALHSYFTISQIKQVHITGLAGATYENTVASAGTQHTQGDAPLSFAAETDYIFATPKGCTLHDAGLGRTIAIEKTGSGSTVIWNPWDAKAKAMSDFGDDEWPGMVCIEAANIAPNTVTIGPGSTHTTAATIQVETLR